MIIDAHGHISIAPEVLAYKAQISASLLNPDQGRPRSRSRGWPSSARSTST